MSAPDHRLTEQEPRELPIFLRAYGKMRKKDEVEATEKVTAYLKAVPDHSRDLDELESEVMHSALRQSVGIVARAIPVKETDRLAEIALLLRTIPYGELMEFAAQTGGDAGKIWEWATK